MSSERFKIFYPKTDAGKKDWNKRYGSNAYWAGKHHAQRTEDARYWHALTQTAISSAKCRKKPFEKPVVITFLWNDRLDLDNHSMMSKMIIDGMKHRLINDDTRKFVKGIEHYWHDKPYIDVRVMEVTAGEGDKL